MQRDDAEQAHLPVRRIRVKIALNVVKASKLAQMKLITWRSKLGSGGGGGISKIFCFCPQANMVTTDKGISLKRKFLKKLLLNFTN